jgi:Na+/melibiose symporter-like transporter
LALRTHAAQELSTFAGIKPPICCFFNWREFIMSLGTILIIILILVLIGVIPTWPHSTGWGYGPSGLVGTILVILLILVLLGRI